MIKKLITLFKLGRKVAKSDILNITSKFKKPPVAIEILFYFLSFSFSKKKQEDLKTKHSIYKPAGNVVNFKKAGNDEE